MVRALSTYKLLIASAAMIALICSAQGCSTGGHTSVAGSGEGTASKTGSNSRSLAAVSSSRGPSASPSALHASPTAAPTPVPRFTTVGEAKAASTRICSSITSGVLNSVMPLNTQVTWHGNWLAGQPDLGALRIKQANCYYYQDNSYQEASLALLQLYPVSESFGQPTYSSAAAAFQALLERDDVNGLSRTGVFPTDGGSVEQLVDGHPALFSVGAPTPDTDTAPSLGEYSYLNTGTRIYYVIISNLGLPATSILALFHEVLQKLPH